VTQAQKDFSQAMQFSANFGLNFGAGSATAAPAWSRQSTSCTASDSPLHATSSDGTPRGKGIGLAFGSDVPPSPAPSTGSSARVGEAAVAAAAAGEAAPPLPRRVARNMFHKTKMCNFFLAGKCRKHGSCNFAHSEAELSHPPDLHCTKMCPSVAGGVACTDANCKFAHEDSELRKKPVRAKKDEVAGPGAPAVAAPAVVPALPPVQAAMQQVLIMNVPQQPNQQWPVQQIASQQRHVQFQSQYAPGNTGVDAAFFRAGTASAVPPTWMLGPLPELPGLQEPLKGNSMEPECMEPSSGAGSTASSDGASFEEEEYPASEEAPPLRRREKRALTVRVVNTFLTVDDEDEVDPLQTPLAMPRRSNSF